MIKELWILAKMLLKSKPSEEINRPLEILSMKNFPFKGKSVMSWCGNMIVRIENQELLNKFLETEEGKRLTTHEHGHIVQAHSKSPNSWLPFYLSYFWNWIKHGLMNPLSANYYLNKYECEAFANEDNPDYWLNYNPENLDKRYEIEDAKNVWRVLGGTKEDWKEFLKCC